MIGSTVSMQWLRRYRIFFFIGLLLLGIQFFLGYLLPIFETTDDAHNSNTASIYSSISNEANVQKSRAAFNQLFEEENLSFDDDEEEDISNSNSIVSFKDVANGIVAPKIVVVSSSSSSSSAKGGVINQPMISSNVNINQVPSSNSITNTDNKQQQKLHQPHQPQLNTQTDLKLGELTFQPICDIVAKEAISAVIRAQTQLCKQTIINITCAIQNGQFYPASLPSYCPHEPFSKSRPLGCYKDDKKFRTLSGYYINFKTTNTPKRCIQLCLQSGFVYAGVQYS